MAAGAAVTGDAFAHDSDHLDVTAMTVTSPDGVELRVRVAGPDDAPAVLFAHGFAQGADSFGKQLNSALTENYRVVAVDLRGHGGSTPKTGISFEGKAFADDIEAVRTALDIDTMALVGWSFGVGVVGDYLTHYGQEHVSAVVAVAGPAAVGPEVFTPEFLSLVPALTSTESSVFAQANWDLVDVLFAEAPSSTERLRTWATEMRSPATARAAILARTSQDSSAAYQALTVPVWVVRGSADEVITPAGATQVAELVPNAEVTVYDGLGHSVFSEDADQFNADLADFLNV
jgi:pimeloyl-ACP methyl ester carboxylesterase